MDKTLFVIAVAIGAAVLSTSLAVFMQGRDLSPKTKRMLWVALATGVVLLVVLSMAVLV